MSKILVYPLVLALWFIINLIFENKNLGAKSLRAMYEASCKSRPNPLEYDTRTKEKLTAEEAQMNANRVLAARWVEARVAVEEAWDLVSEIKFKKNKKK